MVKAEDEIIGRIRYLMTADGSLVSLIAIIELLWVLGIDAEKLDGYSNHIGDALASIESEINTMIEIPESPDNGESN